MINKIAFTFGLDIFLGVLAFYIPWVALGGHAPLYLQILLTITVVLGMTIIDINIIRDKV